MIYSENIKYSQYQFVQPWTYSFYIESDDSLSPSIADVAGWCESQPGLKRFGFTNRAEDTLWWFEDKDDALLFAIRFGFSGVKV